jgi:WD40 repeat protein
VRETLQKVVSGVQERDRLEQHEAKMISGLSADGRQLANLKQYGFDCSWDNLACLWDKSGEQMVKFLGSQRYLTGTVFSPDRSKFITVSSKDGGGFIEDNTSIVRLWDLNRNELIADFKGHQSEVWSVSFSPDGSRIAIAGDDGISLWDLNGKQVPEFQRGQGRVTYVGFSPDGTQLASIIDSTSSKGYQNVRFWNLKGQQVGQLKGDLLVDTVIFSPDGTQLATTRKDTGGKGTVRLWDLLGNQVSQFRAFGSVVFSSDGSLLTGSGEDGVPRVWNLSGRQLFEFKGHQGLASGRIFSPDGKQLITTGDDKIIRLWDLNDKAVGEFGGSGGTFKMIFSPDGSLVATYKDNAVSLWDLQGNKLGEVPTNKSEYIPKNITISPDSQQLAIVEDNIARLWNWRNKQQLEEFTEPQGMSLVGISFSGDRSLLVMTGQDKTVRLWNWTGEQVAKFKDLQGQSNRIILSPDNSRIVTIENGNLLLWNLEGKQIAQVNGALNNVNLDDRYIGDNVILSRNNKLVAINGEEGITVWNWNSKQIARFREGHAMDFSPDGRLLATNQNLTYVVCLLDLTSGRQVAEYPTPANFAVQFSPDGKWLLTGGNDVPQLWRVESLDDLMVRGCDWVRDYLANNPNVAERDHHLCDGIGSRK